MAAGKVPGTAAALPLACGTSGSAVVRGGWGCTTCVERGEFRMVLGTRDSWVEAVARGAHLHRWLQARRGGSGGIIPCGWPREGAGNGSSSSTATVGYDHLPGGDGYPADCCLLGVVPGPSARGV
eukprot:CAMPEP_0204355206 /NCGR_PEP_ID=MMETSP0469-20131031/33974_1 /ASSEMBLY_ACC=CAM_ASM_000384 /TAXON_ID=2969 /ORGANISM="Oxyrrhis marina" /LENGTH=124 /DNA_ID=CAMNT_0051342415 /DNA_START=96 /DNA_END=470 /DNA_ORIENTATION=+